MGKKNKIQKNKLGKMSQKDNVDNLEDIARWGSSKKNYYQEVDDQYASISEEQQQAERIYNQQYQLLNDQDIYKLNDNNNNQQEKQIQQSEQQSQQEEGISQQYIQQQLQWALTFAEMCQALPLEEKYKQLYTKMINTYLLILISLKQLKVPYIIHHPILNDMSQLRIKLKVAEKRLQELMKKFEDKIKGDKYEYQQQQQQKNFSGDQLEDQQDINIEQEQLSEGQKLNFNNQQSQSNEQQQSSQQQQTFRNTTQKGLYEKLKKQQEIHKKQKKQVKKQQFEQKKVKKQKPIFKQIEANQSRLLSEMIQKNKGLMKKRKRTDGNSRVKLRRKYQKAQKKQRARGHFVRENPGRDYEGQANIKYGKLSAVKLK